MLDAVGGGLWVGLLLYLFSNGFLVQLVTLLFHQDTGRERIMGMVTSPQQLKGLPTASSR